MIYVFGPYELDIDRAELRAAGEPRSVERQVFALLAYLVEHRDRLVPKDELFDKLWEGRVVTESALSKCIKEARKAVDDDGRTQAVIKTVHGQGLRFVADVQVSSGREPVIRIDNRVDLAPEAEPTLPDRPSIAVLPFRQAPGTSDFASMADGIPHELISELARLRWLFVVARGSSFRLRGEGVDPREVGRLLNVRYCLGGAIEVSDSRLVVTAELSDTQAGNVIWAERYEGDIGDLHLMREEIRTSILTTLEVQIPQHEASRARRTAPDELGAWSAYHLGLQRIYRFNRSDNSAAAELFSHALALDPGFARAHAGLSFVHFQTAFLRHTDDVDGAMNLARESAQLGIDLDPLDPFVNFTMGRTFLLQGDHDRALSWLDRATTLSPNYAQGIYTQAWIETLAGRPDAGMTHVDLAMRLSPLDPLYYAMLTARSLSHIARGEDAEAAEWSERAACSPGAHTLISMVAAAAHTLAGDPIRAKHWKDDVQVRHPALSRSDFFRACPMRLPEMAKRMDSALRSVGFAKG